tara:strand:- start:329 stop:985 length:657 start_codon:yes stop_codon:yes gene_type:complete
MVIKHKTLEKLAAFKGIQFDKPEFIEVSIKNKEVAVLVTGHLGNKSEWSVGESAPYNCKNSYPFAMAEKRAKDRVILKLVGLHGDVYSEDEADDFSVKPSYTIEQKSRLDDALNRSDSLSMYALMSRCTEDQATGLFNSFRRGDVSVNKEKIRQLSSQGSSRWKKIQAEIENALRDSDAKREVVEYVEGENLSVSDMEFLYTMLDKHDSNQLKQLMAG